LPHKRQCEPLCSKQAATIALQPRCALLFAQLAAADLILCKFY
jgi:hypothetical protein